MSVMFSSNKKDGERIIIRGGGTAPAAMRKGPWTEEEDAQLVRFVRLFGERRWDFLAKVSGLMRTGKSCRLRWVNYLNPDLRRGRITADEERLIVELHAQWGSRWSRIARNLPGRTDNEIKNFWRTRTRKHKAAAAASPASSSSSSAPAVSDDSAMQEGSGGGEVEEESTAAGAASRHEQAQQEEEYNCSSMDQLWNEIAAADAAAASYVLDSWGGGGHCYFGAVGDEPPPSPVWEYCSDYSLWRIDDEEYIKMLDAS